MPNLFFGPILVHHALDICAAVRHLSVACLLGHRSHMVDYKPLSVQDDVPPSHSVRFVGSSAHQLVSQIQQHASRRRTLVLGLSALVVLLLLIFWPGSLTAVSSLSPGWLGGNNAFGAELPLASSASLHARLKVWEEAPFDGLDHAVSLYPMHAHPGFCSHSRPQACSEDRLGANVDPQTRQEHGEFWQSLKSDKDALGKVRKRLIQALRCQFVLLRSLSLSIFLLTLLTCYAAVDLSTREHGKGRGIVMAASNRDALSQFATTVSIIRSEHFSLIPVEVFHLPSERPTEAQAAIFSSFGATLREITPGTGRYDEDGREWSYQIKASAIIESSFSEVLFLDSDSGSSPPTRSIGLEC
jgi:hypothetical protein